jgi:glycosyltransferase involved in cell wall biosynthesis
MGGKVSVVMPVRDAETTVGAAIDSILSQSFADFELIVVDNGSVDGSRAVAAARALADRRVRLLVEPEPGIVPALDRGLAYSGNDLIARMDADDVSLPHRLQRQVDFLARRPAVDAVGTGIVLVKPEMPDRISILPSDSRVIRRNLASLNTRFVVAHPTVLMRRRALEAAGGYRRLFPHAEDYDLWLRMSERGAISNLPEPLLRYSIAAMDARPPSYRLAQLLGIAAARWAAHRRRRTGRDPFDGFRGPLEDGEITRLAGRSASAFWLDYIFIACGIRLSDADRAARLAAVIARLPSRPRSAPALARRLASQPWTAERRDSLGRALQELEAAGAVPGWLRRAAADLAGHGAGGPERRLANRASGDGAASA